jgi:hypothetical protein
MIIRADSADAGHPTVHEADNFRALSLTLTGDTASPQTGFAALGHWIDDEHVFIDPALIRSAVTVEGDRVAWETGFDAMIAYAAQHGWVDDRGRVRVHVE